MSQIDFPIDPEDEDQDEVTNIPICDLCGTELTISEDVDNDGLCDSCVEE